MQFIPVSDTASLELVFDALGQKCENVIHVKAGTTPITESGLADVCEAVVDWYTTSGKVQVYDGTSLTKIVAKDLTSSTGPAIEYTTGLPLEGTGSGATALPLNVTAVISLGTALRGRSYRGRIYQIGLGSNWVSGNVLDSGYRNNLVSSYGGLVTAISAAGWTLVVVSKFHNKAPRTAGVATTVTSVSVDTNVDSQRRRLAGRGQ